MKILIIYYSLSGNTRKMAEIIANKAREEVDVDLVNAYTFNVENIDQYQAIAIGSSDTNDEEVDDTVVRPLIEEIKGKLRIVPFSLFGSYGWGGVWLSRYNKYLLSQDINVLDIVTCKKSPDEIARLKLEQLAINLIKEAKKKTN